MDVWQQVKGQEVVKRAVEVAAVQQHYLLFLPDTNAERDAQKYGLALCDAVKVQGLVGSDPFHYDVTVRYPAITLEKLMSTKLGEPLTAVQARIDAARVMVNDVPPTLDNAGLALMKAAIRQLNFDQTAFDSTISIARSIAALAGVTRIGPAHLAEAVQYRPRMTEEQE
jgi:predicted ATPase with chaperone activity